MGAGGDCAGGGQGLGVQPRRDTGCISRGGEIALGNTWGSLKKLRMGLPCDLANSTQKELKAEAGTDTGTLGFTATLFTISKGGHTPNVRDEWAMDRRSLHSMEVIQPFKKDGPSDACDDTDESGGQ